jgi:uncharacterized protein YjbI with pentapeptide repeats
VLNLAMRTGPSLSIAVVDHGARGLDRLDRRRLHATDENIARPTKTFTRPTEQRATDGTTRNRGSIVSELLEQGAEGQSFRDQDWYAEQIGAVRFVDCVLTDVDLTEAATSGTTFERCTFHTCRFNASTHRATAFVGCDFRRCNLFTATLDGCKLTGSAFTECTLRPITVKGGAWGSVTLRGADLAGVDLTGVDLREADLSMASLAGAVLASARLDGATVRDADLTRADLRKASVDRVDLAAATLRETRIDLQAAVLLAELQGAVVDLGE